MRLIARLFITLFISNACCYFKQNAENEISDGDYCRIDSECRSPVEHQGFLFYNVHPGEGFNLRRDVYLRLAIFFHELCRRNNYANWQLVLPPWNDLYHWRLTGREYPVGPFPWSSFFNIDALRSFVPVIELQETFDYFEGKKLVVDRIYALQNFEDAFESGEFIEKWKVIDSCHHKPDFWGYGNITYRSVECVQLLGGASKLGELLALHPSDKTVMFTDAQIALHEHYNDKLFWTARKSVKFSDALLEISTNYIKLNFDCHKEKCDNYIGVHWRRGDFARSRKKDVPTIEGAFNQISHICSDRNIYKVFIATDASKVERQTLQLLLQNNSIEYHNFITMEADNLNEGQIAIIDQIICSRSAYFVGTHESTFSFRIQEEREIMGFNSEVTFNRLCPDKGRCEKPSKWQIVN